MGLKRTSELIAVSFGFDETGPNVFTQQEIALQLDILNNEIAVVMAIDIDLGSPDAVVATNTQTIGSITTTSQTATQGLGNSNTLAVARDEIRSQGFVDGGVAFSRKADSSYTGAMDSIGYIATNNFFVQVIGGNNVGAKTISGRVWLYRAKADASTYAALVQSEVLSA
jgi:hypothetical protein